MTNNKTKNKPDLHDVESITRRHFLRDCSTGLGAMFMASAAGQALGSIASLSIDRDPTAPTSPLPAQFAGKAKRVIYLHMAGAPSQLELFDYKPELIRYDGKDTPASFLEGKRFAFISGVPKLLGPRYPFHQTGESGAWISDRFPHLEKHIDDLCFIKSMRTDQFNHAPAQLLLQTGNARLGYPSLGAWVTYGLGTENQNLPGFVVLISGEKNPSGGKLLWGSGFLPGVFQGVETRSQGEPVLYLNNPNGLHHRARREMIDAISDINRQHYLNTGDPETITRVAQYELASRMQLSANNAMNIKHEPDKVIQRYGATPGITSFANNCLLARRLAERDVRFIQLYHWGWDSHGDSAKTDLDSGFANLCNDIDKPIAALLQDLKERGLLEDTLVIWGGEFGRTPMRENRAGQQMAFIGRDHNPGAFTIWMAGGGVKPGISYGKTDEMGYNVVENPVEVRDLHATMLYLLGFDHHKFTYPFQGLDQKITGVMPSRIISEIIS